MSEWKPKKAATGPLRVVYVRLDEARRWDRNPKRHDIPALMDSIRRHGFRDPPIYDAALGAIVAGNGRVEALGQLATLDPTPPTGIAVDASGAWCVPILVGVDAASRSAAESFGIDHNALTLAGADIPASVVAQLFDGAAMTAILADMDAAPVSLAREIASAESWVMGHLRGAPAPEEVEPPEPRVDEAAALAVKWGTAPGQVWEIPSETVPGRCHRVACGDCRNPADVVRLLDGARVNVAFTSPPYASQRKYDEESGFKPIRPDDYVEWFEAVQENVKAHLAPDGSWFVNIKEHCDEAERHLYVKDLTVAHVRQWGWNFVDELVWLRSGVPGAFPNRFKNGWEPVFHFYRSHDWWRPVQAALAEEARKVGLTPSETLRLTGVGMHSHWFSESQWTLITEEHYLTLQAHASGAAFKRPWQTIKKQHDALRVGLKFRPWNVSHASDAAIKGTGGTPVKAYGDAFQQEYFKGQALPTNVVDAKHSASSGDHPAAFPVGLPAFFIKAYSDTGDLVFDPFLGSGTTTVAAEREGRLGYGLELSPKYLGVILQRLADMGLTPTLVEG